MTPEIRRRRLIVTVILLGALIVLAVLIAMRPRPQRQRPPVAAPLVTFETVGDQCPPIEVTGWGTVQPKYAITLVPQVSGKVVAVAPNLQAGAFFTAGEILVEIESTDYELAVRQARSQVAQADVGLAIAREEAAAARHDWLRTMNDAAASVEPGPLVFREPQLRQAEAQLAAAQAALDRAELDLARCRLTAPFTGRVLTESVSVGQYVRAGEVLAGIYDTAIAEITVPVSDRELAWIRVPLAPSDSAAGAAATVRATFAGGDHTWPARAVRLGGAVDQGTRQVPVVVEVQAPYRRTGDQPPLLSGMFVAVTFTSEPPPGAVAIPRHALRPGDQVWLLDDDDRLRLRPVAVARAGLETAVIAAGLAPGDRVITSNLQYVSDGMQLTAADPDPTLVPAADQAADAAPAKGGRP
jgi:RND family efflux transporter MFP subunit